jgi:LPXTG-motif cell wall-anchored protein
VSAQTALPTTGSEGGLAAIAAVLVTAGMGLTMLSKRRGTQQA